MKGIQMRKKSFCFVLALIISLGMIGCNTSTVSEVSSNQETIEKDVQLENVGLEEGATPEEAEGQEETLEPIPEEKEESEIVLMAVGDNLMHMGIVATGKQEDDSYNYDVLFQGMEEYINAADIRMINQETILGGNDLGFSGYPLFNSPTQVGDAIAKAGFNVVLHSSNHSADKGLEGLVNCENFWESNYPQITMVGIYEESNEEHPISILEVQGKKFAILNYTYSPNSEILPKSMMGRLDMLCNWNKENGQIDFTTLHPQVIRDIERAEEIADFTIVCPHWGTEYTTTPSTAQKNFAKQMADAGADLIVGTHPHVVQPVEWVEDSQGEKILCYYSLGNYVSTQKNPLCMLEGMAWVTLVITEEGIEICEEETGMIPMVCHYTNSPVRFGKVYFLEEYSQELASKHGIITYGDVEFKLEELQQWKEEIIGEWSLSPTEVLK